MPSEHNSALWIERTPEGFVFDVKALKAFRHFTLDLWDSNHLGGTLIMLCGVFLITAGILIVIYPPLLSIIVAMLLIAMGSMIVAIGYHNRKLRRHYDNPVIELFFRF